MRDFLQEGSVCPPGMGKIARPARAGFFVVAQKQRFDVVDDACGFQTKLETLLRAWGCAWAYKAISTCRSPRHGSSQVHWRKHELWSMNVFEHAERAVVVLRSAQTALVLPAKVYFLFVFSHTPFCCSRGPSASAPKSKGQATEMQRGMSGQAAGERRWGRWLSEKVAEEGRISVDIGCPESGRERRLLAKARAAAHARRADHRST